MKYPFVNKDYRIYPITFLQNVIVECYYTSSGKVNEEKRNKLLGFFKESFNITLPQDALTLPVAIVAKGHAVNMSFGFDAFKLRVGVKEYKGFNTFNSLLEGGLDFLNILQVPMINSLKIKKINIWPYEIPEGRNTGKDILLQKIFSKDLLSGSKLNFSQNENLTQWMNEKVFSPEELDGINSLSLKYGFLSGEKSNKGSIILDSVIEHKEIVELSKVNQVLIDVNQVLFDAYNWSVNPKIIEFMERKGEGNDGL